MKFNPMYSESSVCTDACVPYKQDRKRVGTTYSEARLEDATDYNQETDSYQMIRTRDNKNMKKKTMNRAFV